MEFRDILTQDVFKINDYIRAGNIKVQIEGGNVGEDRGLSKYANKWVQEILTKGEFEASPDNPFFYKNKELRLSFNNVKIDNAKKGDGLIVTYIWNGVPVCIFPVPNMSVDYAGPSKVGRFLSLEGIEGSLKMVIG